MMRSGRLLVEESPQSLLNNYRVSSLEDVFLKLCIKDEAKNLFDGKTVDNNTTEVNDSDPYTASVHNSPEGYLNLAYERYIGQLNNFKLGMHYQL